MKKITIAFTTLAFICCGLLWISQVDKIGFSLKTNLSGAYLLGTLGWFSALCSQIMSK